MEGLKTFVFKECTKNGYYIIGGGISPYNSSYNKAEIQLFIDSIKEFEIEAIEDPFYIDYKLASYVKKICTKTIYALGVSIHIPNVISQTGGIIGNPHIESSSADGLSQNIGNGLSVAAYPGGPGIIIQGNEAQAKNILESAEIETGGKDNLIKMVDKARKMNIKTAIIISDGTGIHSEACVITLDNKRVKWISID